ncbi:hypothetical protein HMPREF1979_01809 [Actinomyces johnsonii F0542]|uniref:Uncharacterized protein n=1 Tax=Actinomyces johnsonii F0542 TaxID=1321818 RepID=U1Q6E2_9ACTO|nr:hypothetical protein HMPREF1979_01809 [Actinomyces johnsonii F0542]
MDGGWGSGASGDIDRVIGVAGIDRENGSGMIARGYRSERECGRGRSGDEEDSGCGNIR